MNKKKYSNFWLIFVNLKAKDSFVFNDLIDFEGSTNNIIYNGAWANVIVQSESIKEAIDIVHLGLNELDFEVVFIDKIENIGSLIEYNEIKEEIISEVDWLSKSEYVFKISDKLFPYE